MRLALLGRAQAGSAKMLKEEVLEAQVPYLDSALAVSGVPGDSSAVPVADPGHPRPGHPRPHHPRPRS